MQLYGKKLTTDWVLDAEGRPTDDPQVAEVLLPFGGVKGSGFSIMMDIFSSVLPCGVATTHRQGEEFAGQQRAAHYVQAIDIAKFTDVAAFKGEMDRMIRTVRASRRKPGVERIYLPGEIEWLKKEAWNISGIPLHHRQVEDLQQIAAEVGINGQLATVHSA